MKLYKEKAGVISEDPCWVLFFRYKMYTGDTLFGLIKDILRGGCFVGY